LRMLLADLFLPNKMTEILRHMRICEVTLH
jgi:hypothetical protein